MASTTGIAAPTSIFSQEPTKPVDGTNNNAFGQDAFLKLLVSQLRFQDPSEPVDNQQFLGQMAQFTDVEQLVKLNKSLDQMAGSTTKVNAVSLLGAEVDIQPSGQILKEGEAPSVVSGIVKQIRFEGNVAHLEVNGKEYLLDDILKVRMPQQP